MTGLFKMKRVRKRGMTLVEVMVSVSLFTIIMLAVTSSIAALYKYNSYTISQTYQVYHARRGVESLVRDVREMTFADDGSFPLARMENNIIGFYSDIDRDDSVEYVEYELATTTILYKRVYNATGTPVTYNLTEPDEIHVLSEYVQNMLQGTSTFFYYDRSGNLANSSTRVTDIGFIRVQAIVNIDAVKNPGQFMLRGSAALRNIINNS